AALMSPFRLGAFHSRGAYLLSQTRADLIDFELLRQGASVLKAVATVMQPYGPRRSVTFSASGITLELADSAKWLHSLRAVPPSLVDFAERFRSGTVMLTELALKTSGP